MKTDLVQIVDMICLIWMIDFMFQFCCLNLSWFDKIGTSGPIGTSFNVLKLFLNQFTKEKYQFEQVNRSKFLPKIIIFVVVI